MVLPQLYMRHNLFMDEWMSEVEWRWGKLMGEERGKLLSLCKTNKQKRIHLTKGERESFNSVCLLFIVVGDSCGDT